MRATEDIHVDARKTPNRKIATKKRICQSYTAAVVVVVVVVVETWHLGPLEKGFPSKR